MNIRIGNGWDFHRLIESPQRPFMLGGFEIPGKYSLEGHSDADVLLHALCDAIGGALGLGDIGTYFPDSDDSNKNLDSVVFLQHYLEFMQARNCSFINVDLCLIGEQPKIKPWRGSIVDRLSELLKIDSSQIGLKATTTEKMGALGRAEGLACMASVLLIFN